MTLNTNRNLSAASYEEAVRAIAVASPGDTITLKNGIWSDIQLDFTGKGTADLPIILQAETPGEVIFTGASTLTVSGEYLVVQGLYFKEGVQPGKDGNATIIRFLPDSRNCRLTDTAIVDYRAADRVKKYFWVTVDGAGHRIDHCYFKGKDYAGQLLRNIKYSHHNRIDHNHFVDIPAYGINGLEIIQVMGIGSDGESGTAGGEHVIIEHNLFERADGECEEVISLKSNHDIVRGNTFKDSIGGLVIRSGHNTVVEDNYFIGGNVAGTKGIRITGEDNVVSRNYMTGLQGFALSIMSGEYIDKDLTGAWQPILREGTPLGRVPFYNWSKRNTVAGNVMIHNDGTDLDIGIGYKSGWPGKQRILLPEDNDISDNVIVKEKGAVFTAAQQDPSVMDIAFAPNRYANNYVCARSGRTPLPEGMKHAEIELNATPDGFYEPVLPDSIASMPRSGPLNEALVGPDWVKRKQAQGEPLFQPRDQFATVETVPWDDRLGVWVFCAGSTDMFVRNMRTKLDAQHRRLCPIQRDGAILLPVRAAAEKLGLRVTDGHEYTDGRTPVMVEGIAFLTAGELADIFGKWLLVDEKTGIVVMSDEKAALSAFEEEQLIERSFRLFRAAASRFEKYMTIPPEGHTHGRIPANTLNGDPSSHWASYGDGEWIRYDLGGTCEIGSVGIAFVRSKCEQYAFDIDVSADGFHWHRVFSGMSAEASEGMETFPFEPVGCRFVRITGHGNSCNNANRYSQVQVYTPQGSSLL